MFTKFLTGHSFWLVLLLVFLVSKSVLAQSPPAGFASATVSSQWNEAVGLTFNSDGSEMFVWERGGRVWVVNNGQKSLVLNISDEVGAWHDHGLLGFALHPRFEQNGYIYLLYLVDRHYLMNFGTASYNPAANDYFSATIGRLTRYTISKSGLGYSVIPGSRKILIGETKSDGIISTERSHVTGALVFGTDQTLLVGTGDGANGAGTDTGNGGGTYFAQALADGILTPAYNVGAFRSQILDCLNGKILRIDPESGAGIPSNPFYDPTRPNSPVSKVWSLGIRQPFRMSMKPGTGSHNPADGNPGTLYVGEVGYFSWEELNVVDRPGLNFGWPIYEGLTKSTTYGNILKQNLYAPNPLFQSGGCTQQFFDFQDLLKPTTPSGTETFTNPCNPAELIPATTPTFVHAPPIIDWFHSLSGPSRTGIFNGQTHGVVNIGAAGSPVSGPQFGGSAAVAGVFYTGQDFPEEYRNTFFFGDYGSGWMRNITMDEADKPVQVRNFINSGSIVVAMASHPAHEGLYYINFPSEIRRVYYDSNRPPVAVASADVLFGTSPLTVQFTGHDSSDPEDQSLGYEWNFGDGSPINNEADPIHVFVVSNGSPAKFTVTLKVRDHLGVTDQKTLTISINNTPPHVDITSPPNNFLYPLTGETVIPLQAMVSDSEHSNEQLTYAWQTILHHQSHQHPEPIDSSPETTTNISPLGCQGETYFYRITLTVTDASGASTTKEVRIYPDCENIVKIPPVITWLPPSPIFAGAALSSTQLNATATHNGIPVAGTFTYTPAAGAVLPLGTGQVLSVNFVPADGNTYSTVSRTVTIDVISAPSSTFYRAINLNGPALSIDGNGWTGSAGAPNFSYTTNGGLFSNQAIGLNPSTDASRASMIRSSIWGKSVALNVTGVPAGSYQVWLYVWEDNFAQSYSISLEGGVVQANFNSGTTGAWQKLGPYPVTISDGAINLSAIGGDANLSGIEIWTAGPPPPNRPPVVSNALADQVATVGTAFSYTFPVNSFSDPDAGTTLAYSSVLENGSPLPGWLLFNGSTRNFSGTPGSAHVGSVNVRVTASDGEDSVSDLFTLTVNRATPLLTWTNPSPIVVGTALASTQLNATASHNGTPVPGVFTYTPGAGTVLALGTGQQLTVEFLPSDAVGYNSASKTVTIDVNSSFTPVLTWASPSSITVGTALSSTQLNATATHNGIPVAGIFTYTPAAGTVLPLGTGQVLSVNFVPADGTTYSTVSRTVTIDVISAPSSTFYRAINLNGPALNIDGNSWAGSAGAPNFSYTTNGGLFSNQAIGLNPSTDASRASMIRSSIWGKSVALNVTGVPAGSYQVWLYVWEDNFAQTYSISLEGGVVQANFNSGTTGAWRKLGPYPVAISDGAINLSAIGGDANLSGIEIWTAGPPPPNRPPVVSNALADQVATVGTAFSYTFPVNSFSDPDAGTTLAYSSVLENGSPLPGWLLFNGSTRNFSGTPGSAHVGSVNVRVTASDGEDSVSDLFTLTVNRATPLLTWANPSPIVVGTALSSTQLNATALHNGTPVPGVFTYTPGAGTVLALGTGQQLTVEFIPSDAVGYNSASKTVIIDVTPAIIPLINWSNPAPIVVGTALSSLQLNATATHNGVAIPGIFTYTPPAGTILELGNGQILSVEFVPNDQLLYETTSKTVSIDVTTKLTPLLSWSPSSPITVGTALGSAQLNATATHNGIPVAGTFTYTPAAGTVLPLGTGQVLSVNFVPADGNTYSTVSRTVTIDVISAPSSTFYRAINLNGPALNIDGNSWTGSAGAPNFSYTTNGGLFSNQAIGLNPSTDASRASMIRSSIWGKSVALNVTGVPAGSYQVWLYVWEDNFAQTYSISLEGGVVQANFNSGTTGAWQKLGPYPVTISDGAINLSAIGGDANLSGIEIWTAGPLPPNRPPVVSNALADQVATVGTAFSYTFPVNSFSDPDAGTTLAYSSVLENGSPLPGWLLFNGSTRNFSGTPGSAHVGSVNVRVTASDGEDSVSDLFTLTVNRATPLLTWTNPSPIVVGTTLSSTQLNATASHNGTPVPGVFTYTPGAGTVLALGTGQQLTVEFIPSDAVGYNSASKTVTIDVNSSFTPVLTWASPSSITVGTALSSTQLNATATHNGIPVAGIFTYTPAAGTVLPLGTGQVLSVNFVPADGTTYSTVSRTVTIDVISAPSSTFYRAINLNGPALNIDGNSWAGSAGAPNFSYTTNGGLFSNQAIGLNPSTDASRASMIRSSIWGKSVALNVTGVPAGSYQVWLYVWEDNFAQTYSISLEGGVVQANFNSGTTGAWQKLGPYPVAISDGAINLLAIGGDANLSGIEIWRSNQGQSSAKIAFEDDIEGEILPEDANSRALQMTVYPNPSSGLVNIEFTTVESGVTHVAVYNTRGEQLQILYNTVLPAGRHAHIEMQPAEWVNGIYVIQLINGKVVKYVKVALTR